MSRKFVGTWIVLEKYVALHFNEHFILTTPGDRTKIRGVFVDESCTTCCMSSTGGSTNLEPRLLVINEVAQKDTLSGRSDRMSNIFCNSLQALSHSPGGTR